MKTRKTDNLFSTTRLLQKIEREYRSLFNYSVNPENVPAVITRIDELYAQVFLRDLKDCEAELKKIEKGGDTTDLNNMISILNHIVKNNFENGDLIKFNSSKLVCAQHVTDYLKYGIERASYIKFLRLYLADLKDEVTLEDGLLIHVKPNQKRFQKPGSMTIAMPTCAREVKKILATLDDNTTDADLFALYAKIIKEFNDPTVDKFHDKFDGKPKMTADYCRDNKAFITSLHFNDVTAGKVKLPNHIPETVKLRR